MLVFRIIHLVDAKHDRRKKHTKLWFIFGNELKIMLLSNMFPQGFASLTIVTVTVDYINVLL